MFGHDGRGFRFRLTGAVFDVSAAVLRRAARGGSIVTLMWKPSTLDFDRGLETAAIVVLFHTSVTMRFGSLPLRRQESLLGGPG